MATTQNSDPIARLEIDFNGNEAQAAFVRDRNEETAYIGGVGSGKTVAGLMRLARHIFEWNPGEQLAVVAPTVPMLRNVIVPEMQRWGLLGQDGIEYRRSENLIEYPNGTTVILESANNDRKIERLRGLNLAGAWLDEVAEHQHKTYQILGDRLRTGSYRNLWATGTPKGFNWVHDEFADLDALESEPVADGTLIRGDHTTTIHGVSTAANEANPDDYVRSRERQHAGQSYQQEVEGEFVRFQGLIYDWFDDDHLTSELPEPGDLEQVIYGVDWGYHNPALLAIGRHDGAWVVLEDYLGNETTVSDHLDRAKGMQERWLPGPWYCDPAEPSNIEQFKRAGLAARSAENDVLPGIQHVTSLRDELTVHESCQYLVNELRQYRWKEDGDEMTDTPVKENDHLCFVAGTPIATADGQRPIESIEAGDLVLTRTGYRPVINAGQTATDADVMTLRTTDGRELTGTPDHPIHTPHGGFKQMDTLRYGEQISSIGTCPYVCRELIQSSTRASSSDAIRIPTTPQIGGITGRMQTTSRTALRRSTVKSGEITTVRSPTGTTSTISTATQPTTTSRTSSVSARKNTPSGIQISAASNRTSTTRKCSKPPKGGISPTKAPNGTKNIGTNRSPRFSRNRNGRSATSVETNSSTTPRLDSVQTPAKPKHDEGEATTTKNESVKSAGSRSSSTSIKSNRPVRVAAVGPINPGQTVYNLTVDGPSEYFANGILVHNCDALRYALYTEAKQAPPVDDLGW